eukprot:Awhi_evm1s1815
MHSEISIHKSLNHPNIVKFIQYTQDTNNVYLVLEMCPNQSLMELLKRRQRLTEVEVRYYMFQLLKATK